MTTNPNQRPDQAPATADEALVEENKALRARLNHYQAEHEALLAVADALRAERDRQQHENAAIVGQVEAERLETSRWRDAAAKLADLLPSYRLVLADLVACIRGGRATLDALERADTLLKIDSVATEARLVASVRQAAIRLPYGFLNRVLNRAAHTGAASPGVAAFVLGRLGELARAVDQLPANHADDAEELSQLCAIVGEASELPLMRLRSLAQVAGDEGAMAGLGRLLVALARFNGSAASALADTEHRETLRRDTEQMAAICAAADALPVDALRQWAREHGTARQRTAIAELVGALADHHGDRLADDDQVEEMGA